MAAEVRYDASVHGEVPRRFLDGCKGDAAEAGRRWAVTREWRAAEKVDTILDEVCARGRVGSAEPVLRDAGGRWC